jgi:hypothetical protein
VPIAAVNARPGRPVNYHICSAVVDGRRSMLQLGKIEKGNLPVKCLPAYSNQQWDNH